MNGSAALAWPKGFDRATLILAGLAGVSLLLVVVVIAVGVVLRFTFATPILGSNEIVQLLSVAVVMLALPFATAQGAHVRVDVLDERIGHAGRLFGDVLSRILSAFVLSVLVWRAALRTAEAWTYADVTNMLSIPLWPFCALLTAGIAPSALVLLVQLILILVRRASL